MYHHTHAETIEAGAQSRFFARPLLPQATDAVALFADIVGYTEHCQSLDPEEVYLLLCEFYRHAGRATSGHDADFVDHFGDAVLAVWNDDTSLGLQALKAMRCGVTLLAEIGQWNEWRRRNNLAHIKVGIGIHAGPVMLGRPLGGYGGTSVFGDTVNIASRLERQTRMIGADMVISDRLFRLASATAPRAALLDGFANRLSVILSGRSEPIDLRYAKLTAEAVPFSATSSSLR